MNTDLKEELDDQKSSGIKLMCPTCGTIPQDDVIFLCNHCKEEELIEKNGVFICPKCLKPGQNFECMKCGSKEVKISPKDRSDLKNKTSE